jgi:hypothetical protein
MARMQSRFSGVMSASSMRMAKRSSMKATELEDAGRIDQPGLEQRLLAVDALLVGAEQEGLLDELPDLGFDVTGHAALSCLR